MPFLLFEFDHLGQVLHTVGLEKVCWHCDRGLSGRHRQWVLLRHKQSFVHLCHYLGPLLLLRSIIAGLSVRFPGNVACHRLEHRLVVLWLDRRVSVTFVLHHSHVVPLRRALAHVSDERLEVIEGQSVLLDLDLF